MSGSPARRVWKPGAAPALALALEMKASAVPSWWGSWASWASWTTWTSWVLGGMAGLCGAVRLLLAAPSTGDLKAQGALFDDEASASRNAALRAELTR